jgi:hypothetical protein
MSSVASLITTQARIWPRKSFVFDPRRLKEMLGIYVLYFYCHCSVKDGSDPVLQSGEAPKTSDRVRHCCPMPA